MQTQYLRSSLLGIWILQGCGIIMHDADASRDERNVAQGSLRTENGESKFRSTELHCHRDAKKSLLQLDLPRSGVTPLTFFVSVHGYQTEGLAVTSQYGVTRTSDPNIAWDGHFQIADEPALQITDLQTARSGERVMFKVTDSGIDYLAGQVEVDRRAQAQSSLKALQMEFSCHDWR